MTWYYRGEPLADEGEIFDRMADELSADDFERYLSDNHDPVQVWGWTADAGRVLRELDPVQFAEWLDSERAMLAKAIISEGPVPDGIGESYGFTWRDD